MSRTVKDRPYWVKVNEYGVEHHDHSSLGKEVWGNREMKDKNGNLVHEEVPFYHSVGDLLARPEDVFGSWPYLSGTGVVMPKRQDDGREIHVWRWNKSYRTVMERSIHKMRSEAMHLRAHGSSDKALVVGGTLSRPKMEKYLVRITPDHCTINEKVHSRGRWNGNPCYMESDWNGEKRSIFKYRCSCCSPLGYNTAKRAIARDTLKEVSKQFNSGEDDWEDAFDARENITPRRKAGQSWW